MKYAALSGALFLVSYVLVNGGIGSQPMRLLVPTVVAIAVASVVAWFGRRRKARRPKSDMETLLQDPLGLAAPRPRTPAPPSTPPRPGGGARKLF